MRITVPFAKLHKRRLPSSLPRATMSPCGASAKQVTAKPVVLVPMRASGCPAAESTKTLAAGSCQAVAMPGPANPMPRQPTDASNAILDSGISWLFLAKGSGHGANEGLLGQSRHDLLNLFGVGHGIDDAAQRHDLA